jgi:hypothetical protein
MKIIISERQLRQIIESENKISDKKLKMYKDTIDEIGLELAVVMLNKELWEFIEMGLVEHYNEYLGLDGTPIKSLGNLKSVAGSMDLRNTQIEDLGNLTWVANDLYLTNTPIKDLGNLKHVDGDLYLNYCDNLTDLGNLKSVGGYLYLRGTPISRTMSKYDIKKKIKVANIAMLAS